MGHTPFVQSMSNRDSRYTAGFRFREHDSKMLTENTGLSGKNTVSYFSVRFGFAHSPPVPAQQRKNDQVIPVIQISSPIRIRMMPPATVAFPENLEPIFRPK